MSCFISSFFLHPHLPLWFRFYLFCVYNGTLTGYPFDRLQLPGPGETGTKSNYTWTKLSTKQPALFLHTASVSEDYRKLLILFARGATLKVFLLFCFVVVDAEISLKFAIVMLYGGYVKPSKLNVVAQIDISTFDG